MTAPPAKRQATVTQLGCPCPVCVRARCRFPHDPPQLPMPVAIYPSTRRSAPLALRDKEAQS